MPVPNFFADEPKSDTPNFFADTEEPKKEKTFLEKHPTIQKLLTPLVDVSPQTHQAMTSFSQEHPIIGGAGEFLTNLMTGSSSPLQLGLMGLTGGESLAMRAGFPKIAGSLAIPSKIAAGGMVGHGLYNVATEPTIGGKVAGGLEAGLGGIGLRGIKGPTELPKLQLPEQLPIEPETALQLETPKSGTPIYNTPQFGLSPSTQYDPLLQHVPNRLRPPGTNATVFNALLPEQFKTHEQGAARPLTTSIAGKQAVPVTFELKAPLDIPVPQAPKTTNDLILPQAGQAKPTKDISGFTANYTSPDQTLSKFDSTKPIADIITKAQDQKTQWIATTERELSELSTGLNKKDRTVLGQLIDGNITNGPQELMERAGKARVILDAVHDMFPEGSTKAGENVGYLENYFTHLEQQPTDIKSALNRILDHHFGIFKSGELSTEVPGSTNIREARAREASSPYVEERKGNLRNINYDVNEVFPAYIESAARVIFDKPAIQAATEHLANIPEKSNLKELATWYVRNYSNYDSLPGLHKAWGDWANTIARTTSRSLLGFSFPLQTLHLARVAANLYPELGAKYVTYGLKQLAESPIQSWHEAAKLGLLQQEIRPFAFKTTMEKFDSMSNFLSMADYVDKAAGYHGYKKMFLDQGMNEADASLNALRETKRVSQTIDPARRMKGFSPESNLIGGEVGSALGGQFKQIPAKIVEQYMRIAANMKNNPQAATRMVGGIGLALGGVGAGIRTFHVNPLHMIPTSIWGAFGDAVYGVANKLSKGNWEGALLDTVEWATPAAKSIKYQYKKVSEMLSP